MHPFCYKNYKIEPARVATNSCFDAPSEPLIQGLGWLTIEQLLELETVKVVYKSSP